MLKLKRVELQGFKSFCDRTELKFNGGGIAAVVGPNGCGKSNLSDAISWVLGEQSAKSLRGTRMEDVIFAGTRDRKPVGMAYVTLTLVDPEAEAPQVVTVHGENGVNGHANGHSNGQANGQTDGHTNGHANGHANGVQVVESPAAPAAQKPGEITITRRLYRSGESEYLINGRAARLRDIQETFMGTGLGPESYAIIEQGRIGQILSSKPQDRRSVIEEAAGITKYKTRKRLAEAKLESAKQNLSRVFDILEEVTRQVNSLKRQASKAKRYKELKADMEARLRVALAGKFRLLERDAAKSALDLNLASTELKTGSERVAEREKQYETLQAAAYSNEEQLTETRRQLGEAKVEAERTRGRLESQVRESGAIEQRIAQAERESQELDKRLEKLEAEVEAGRKALEEVQHRINTSREHMQEKNQQRDSLQARVREREKAIEGGRQMVLRLLGEASTLRNQLAQIDEYLAGIDRETARSQRESEVAAAEIERLDAAKKKLAQTMSQRQLELEEITGERRRTEEELAVRRRSAVELRGQIDAARNECSRLKARKESVEGVLAHRSYTTDAVKRLFAALEKGKAQDLKPKGVLADYTEVDPAHEKAVEEFLHEELEYVVVENWEQASRGLDFLRTELDGRATFLVQPENGAGARHEFPEPAVGPETGIIAKLSDAVRLTNGLADRAADLLPRLSLCFVAEDRRAAENMAVAYPHLYFLVDGFCYHGHTVTGGKKTGTGPLQLKREARELGAALGSKQKVLDQLVKRQEDLQQEIVHLEAELERLRSAQQAREKDRVALEHDMRKLGEDLSRANSRLSVARLELERLRRDSEKSAEQRERNRAAVEEKERLRAEKERALETERQELEKVEGQAATLSEEHSMLRAELAQLEERSRGQRSGLQRSEQQFRETSARRGQIAPEIERLGVQRARLLADNVELDRKGTLLAEQILQLESAENRLAADEAKQREALRAGDEELKVLRAQVQELHDRRSQIEVDLVKKQAELKFLDETSRKELNCAVAELATGDETVPAAEAIEEAEKEYLEVRARIEALGPVNPQAMEEFQEAQQRQDFLGAQRQDLLDSIRDTEKAIQDIDVISKQKFAEAFHAINENFKGIFQSLFGGGTGEMRLTDEENIAESGIDIVASPPGKKLQNVLLLSGGEKALAAVALLMAIFRYTPSPFCIMDEVDAPLDESNVGRLTTLLKQMSMQTQFVLITHSKKTMEAAQAMYGVTMQEPGVSKLVSVKFQAPRDTATVQ